MIMEGKRKATRRSSLQGRKERGAHYTPRALADFVAKRIAGAWAQETRPGRIRILDPAVGDGELLMSLLGEFPESSLTNVDVFGFDEDYGAVEVATRRIERSFPEVVVHMTCDDFLAFASMYGKGDMFGRLIEPFDLVIANPPYVRTQVLGRKRVRALARQFGLSGRIDLYYAFIVGIAGLLRPSGVAGIIVSNRFMTTRSGADVRELITDKFDILHIWDLGDTRLFEAAVLPAVLLVKHKGTAAHPSRPRFTSVYTTHAASPARHYPDVISALSETGVIELNDGQRFLIQQGKLDHGGSLCGVWRIATEAGEEWLSAVTAGTFCAFGDVGNVRVGVKTTADKVFIRSDWHHMPAHVRPELLRPLITHHVGQRFKAIQPTTEPRQILYPHWVVEGKRLSVNLDEFPRAAKYLAQHRSVLEGREYVLSAGRKWFEIWVPQDPDAWAQPKIVFRDISEKPTFWMDLTGAVVNGDCYWIACKRPQQVDLLWLILAIGNSSFIEMFYDRQFGNKLYAGRRRFMTQYVERFPLPNPETPTSGHIIRKAKQIYDTIPSYATKDLEEELDQLVWRAFGFTDQRNR